MSAPLPALWLCLHLPQLALDALGPWPPGVSLPSLVWQATPGSRAGVVLQANAAARALGVAPGQRLGHAQMLAPGALVLARAPDREAALLERLALSLGRLTPQVVIDTPDLLLDIHASLRLFGGLRALLRRADRLARDSAITPCWGLAPTPLGARLLAQGGDGVDAGTRLRRCAQPHTARPRLLRLPLARLGAIGGAAADLPARLDTLEMLHALGARRLADLHALPRAGLRRRGAHDWVDALDRALGEAPDLRRAHVPPEAFELGLELPWRADTVGAIEHAAVPLVQALCGWLSLRWHAAQALSLRLRHEYSPRRHQPEQRLTLDLGTPTRDPAHVQTLLREHLQHLVLSAPVDAITLVLEHSLADAGRPTTLWPDAQQQAHEHASLIDRLQARLGPHGVQCLSVQADARPEKASRWSPSRPNNPPQRPASARRTSAQAACAAPPGIAPPRPTWLLPEPLALAEHAGRPLHQGEPLRLLTRAERIESGWHDGLLVRRDYHVALGARGLLCWIYRERSPAVQVSTRGGSIDGSSAGAGASAATPRWFLHGLFG